MKAIIPALCILPLLVLSATLHAALPTDFEDELLISGLNQPSSFAFLPDGRVLIVEQNTADVRLVVNDTLATSPIFHVDDVETSGNEQGLLGIAVDPSWPIRPYVYLHFDRTPDSVMYISRFTAQRDLADGTSGTLRTGVS